MDTLLLKNIMVEGKASDILITGDVIGRIACAGSIDTVPGMQVVDCSGKTAFPAFVNMHTHAGMTLMRGIGEDISFHHWLAKIWEVEKNLTEEYIYQATRLACLEMIKSGTATFNDQYWFSPVAVKAALELGIRPAVSYVICDRMDENEAERQKDECMAYYGNAAQWSEGAQLLLSMHSIYSVTEKMLCWGAEFARSKGLKIHIHLSETEKEVEDCRILRGLSPVEYLDRLGVLGNDVIAAHSLWLSDDDVRILGEKGVTCVHNINSNLKLSSGYRFRYNELRDAGANVCLGTDGCGSSNNLDMLEAMKTSAIVQKAWRGDPSCMPLDELAAAATYNGAKALGLNTGRLAEGALADIMIVDTESLHFVSVGSFLSNFVYSAHSDVIDSLISGGRFVMRNRKVENENEILTQARRYVNAI